MFVQVKRGPSYVRAMFNLLALMHLSSSQFGNIAKLKILKFHNLDCPFDLTVEVVE